MKVMLCKPRRGMGRYELLDADDTGGLEFATYFSKFTPNQADWYYKNLKRQMLEALFLNLLYAYPAPQVSGMNAKKRVPVRTTHAFFLVTPFFSSKKTTEKFSRWLFWR